MLNKKVRMTLTGESVINDEVVVAFSASINYEEPEKASIGQVKKNEEAYKQNREECRSDFAAFEDSVFAAQAMLQDMKRNGIN